MNDPKDKFRADQEEIIEREAAARERVKGLIDGHVWQEVVKPALEEKLRLLERHLALNPERDIEGVRFIQGQHKVLRGIIDCPVECLTHTPNIQDKR